MTTAPIPTSPRQPSDWVAVVSPEIDHDPLVHQLGVPSEFIEHAFDADELPRMMSRERGTLIMLRLPVFVGNDANEPWQTQPIALVLIGGRVVAISRSSHPLLDQIGEFAQREARHPARLVLHALELTAAAYLHEVRRINLHVDRLEEQLSRALGNAQVRELLKAQKGFVYFATALRATEVVLERLQKSDVLRAESSDRELLEDVRVEIRQALDMTQTSGDILSQMMDAFASMISNNLNVVMKFLTSVTIILMIPTLMASLWGMNVALPLEHHPLAFVLVLIVSMLGSLVIAAMLAARRWL